MGRAYDHLLKELSPYGTISYFVPPCYDVDKKLLLSDEQLIEKITPGLLTDYISYISSVDYPFLFRRVKQVSVPLHSHDENEIVYIKSGKGVQTVNGQKVFCQKGDLLFFKANDLHSVTSSLGGVDTIHILIKQSVLQEVVDFVFNSLDPSSNGPLCGAQSMEKLFVSKLSLRGQIQHEVLSVLEQMLYEYENRNIAFSSVLKSKLILQISYVLRSACDNDVKGPEKAVQSIYSQVLGYIDENLDKKISLAELAEMNHYTPSYFGVLFKNHFGVTPTEYINQLRIGKACELLSTSAETIGNIALQVGIRDQKNFYDLFKRHIGVSPGQYRHCRQCNSS